MSAADPPLESGEKTSNLLLIGIVVGVVCGALAGGWWPAFGREVAFIGDLFLHALQLMVIPLVVASMIAGIAALGDVRELGGIGIRTIVYYTITTGIAVAIGLGLVNLIQPGKGVAAGEEVLARWRLEGDALVLEGGELERTGYGEGFRVVVQVPGDGGAVAVHLPIPKGAEITKTRIPVGAPAIDGEGPVPAVTSGEGLEVELARSSRIAGKEKTGIVDGLRQMVERLIPNNLIRAMVETEVLPVILFALAFGAVLTTLGPKGRVALDFFEGSNEAILKMVQGLMWTAPVGIFALVAGRLGLAGGFEGFRPELAKLFWYALTVIAGLVLHGLIVLPALLALFARRNPFAYLWGMMTALTTAFSTSSSSATLPITLQSTERLGVRERTASFVCPLGATINMDGTAMYEAVAAMFIAQMYGVAMGPVEQVTIFLTATLAAIGAAGIPEAGIVTMVIVLNAVGLPLEGISLILVIDWFLDRCRTTVNVWGDSVGAAIIDRLEESALPRGARA